MQIAVIGGGVIGVCTAYFLAEAGHDVVVIERHSNVAEQASFGNGGVIACGYATPLAKPGMPKKILSSLFKPESPFFIQCAANRSLWRWLRLWFRECDLERYRINQERMLRVAHYSHAVLEQVRNQYQLGYEQTQGYLQLFRTEDELQMAKPSLDLLAETDLPHRMIDAATVRSIEPALSPATAIAGGVYWPQDESGNCPLFTKQLKTIAQSMGVTFRFNSTLAGIQREANGVSLQVDNQRFHADAVVLAAGADSAQLLEALGISLPICPVKGYSATASIKNFDEAPSTTLMDETYQVTICRLGNRLRLAGITELGTRDFTLRDAALRTLIKVADDWFPGACNYRLTNFWCGTRAMLPDGAPLLGKTPIKNLYINIGHGSTGWSMAAGCGKALADIMSGRAPDIDTTGLTLERYKN